MPRQWKAKIAKRSYRGVVAVGPQPKGPPDEWGLYDLRPHRFAALETSGVAEILTELVNLPDDENASPVKDFINKFYNLALGLTSSNRRKADRMSAKEVIRFRGLYRIFWESHGINQLKAKVFMDLIGPWPDVISSSVESVKTPPAIWVDAYAMLDFWNSALQMDWKTGQFKIVARGSIDFLTHAIFQNRNRLRKCAGKACTRLFIAVGPHEKHCSATCKLEAGRKRKREWFRKNLSKSGKGRGR
jgi:hypothetical protein